MISFQNRALVFFGDSSDTPEKIQAAYPQLKFKKIRQTHSNIVVEASENLTEADAHFTSEVNSALLIATADCLPIMIYCRETHRVAAVHAGWRGVASKITEKTLSKLIATGSNQKNFQIWIGPHIAQNSYEIDALAFEQLAKAHYGLDAGVYAEAKNKKYYIALKRLVEWQINQATAGAAEIIFLDIDTKTNSDYHSYRRDQKTKERNLSFICLFD